MRRYTGPGLNRSINMSAGSQAMSILRKRSQATLFFKALKSIDRFRGECDMRVWLCQIARNTYYSYLKKNSRLASVDGAELSNIADPGAGVEEKVRAREEARQIREALRELPEQYREVFS